MRRKLGPSKQPIQIERDGLSMTSKQAADLFLTEFNRNFTLDPPFTVPSAPQVTPSASQLALLNCTESAVADALRDCSNSCCCPDYISFKTLKSVAGLIIKPMSIIIQQSFHEGIFPKIWKHAVVIPLYKGRGSRSDVGSYRPISLCSCLGKIAEKIVHKQLTAYLISNELLNKGQHGFTKGKSTLTNLLIFDKYIMDCQLAGHSYDVISFDFKKAFEKAPHSMVVQELKFVGVCGTALSWFFSYLTGRTHQVRVENEYSDITAVTSGVVEGSVLGPDLYNILANSLLRRITLPCAAYADDFKFVGDTTILSRESIQKEIDVVVSWSDEYRMPLSLEKCAVLHCGPKQLNFVYVLNEGTMKCVSTLLDLGVLRSSGGGYSDHCRAVASKAARLSGAIRHVFHSKKRELLWTAFKCYVIPVLMYCSPVWNPSLQRDIKLIESIQRRFTKRIFDLQQLSYDDRLSQLQVLSLQDLRKYADMCTVFKLLHGDADTAADCGLFVTESHTRGGGVKLIQQRAKNRVTSSLFACRAPSMWNSLPKYIVSCNSITAFKRALRIYLITCKSDD
jgi:hypothetical protein